jgi:hypothetical protein
MVVGFAPGVGGAIVVPGVVLPMLRCWVSRRLVSKLVWSKGGRVRLDVSCNVGDRSGEGFRNGVLGC